jgi:hypothetical protein
MAATISRQAAEGARTAGRIDYAAPAELFFSGGGAHAKRTTYLRFATAAEAIAFIVEGRAASAIRYATLEVNEARFDRGAIRELYDDPAFPLARAVIAA